jgi:hypothetical protein
MLSICSIPSSSNPSYKGCILKITKELDIAPCIVTTNNTKKTPWVNELNTKVNLSMTESEVSLRKNMFEVCWINALYLLIYTDLFFSIFSIHLFYYHSLFKCSIQRLHWVQWFPWLSLRVFFLVSCHIIFDCCTISVFL